jgi:acyl-CoA synthetase (AMP-forming)/AMP-acid ligase II
MSVDAASPCNTIAETVHALARRAPDATVILAPGRDALNAAALQQQITTTVAALRGHGIRRNDRVAVIVPNGPEMATAFLGVAAGATCAPLNPAYREAELEFYLDDLDAKALIISSELDSPARGVARGRGISIIDLIAGEAAGAFTLAGADAGPSQVEFAQPDDAALVLHTSGTTSRPKQVPLKHENLCASARHIGATLQLAPADRCLNIMPLFHIHGLMAVLSSLTAGASVVCMPGLEIPAFFEWLEAFRPTWYTAAPTMHHAILAGANQTAMPKTGRLRFIRSASSALPRHTLDGLECVFGAPVIETYGMTESASQITSNPLPPAIRKPGSVGLAAGPELAIMDDTGELLASPEVGEVVIRGGNVTQGYVANPEANARAFSHGWFRTGDQGWLDEEGYLFLNGRLKELIDRGGEKIAPVEIDEALLGHPAVSQALTFAMPHPALGEEVAAAVVLRPQMDVTERELREHVSRRLAYFKVPRRILFLDSIPKGPTGKPQRIGLAGRLGLDGMRPPPGEAGHVAPRNAVEEILAAIWHELMGGDAPGVHDNFFAAGGDSIRATQLVARAQGELVVRLSILDFFDGPTVAEAAAIIAPQLAASES